MIAAVLFASFLAPAVYSAAMLGLLGMFYIHRGIAGGNTLPEGATSLIAVFAVFALLAVLGPTFNYGRSGQNVEALKFVVAGAAFAVGLAAGSGRGGLSTQVPWFVAAMTLVYAAQYALGDVLSQEGFVYPPDNNHSAAMLAALLPVVVLRLRGSVRLVCLVLFAAFAFFVASRALLALTILALVGSSRTFRESRVLVLLAIPLAAAVLFYRGFSMDNFSDQLRIQIWEVSFNYATTRGAHAFNFGELAFTNFLNVYPIYRRLEIQHAHNLLMQIWVSYGIVPLILFSVFLVGITIRSFRSRNYLALATLAVVFVFGTIESIITDIRGFGAIMFAIGYSFARTSFRTALRANAPRGNDVHAASADEVTPAVTEANMR